MRNLLILVMLSLFVWGCSSSQNVVNYDAKEHLDYALKLYHNEEYLDAIQEFQSIILQYPGNTVVDDAQYYLAQARFDRSEYIMAAYEFSKLIKTMPASEFVPAAQYKLADCYYELSPDFRLDQQYTKKAIEEFQAFIDFFPTNDKVKDAEQKITELNNKLAHKEYNIAVLYEKMDYYDAALMYYKEVTENYHDTKYAPEASYARIKLLVDRNKYDEAQKDISTFLDRYPDDPNVKEIQDLKEKLKENISNKD